MVATDYCTASRYKGLWANPLKEPQPCNQSQRTMSHHYHLHCVIPANPHLDESWAQFPGTSLCGRIEMTRPRHLVAYLSLSGVIHLYFGGSQLMEHSIDSDGPPRGGSRILIQFVIDGRN